MDQQQPACVPNGTNPDLLGVRLAASELPVLDVHLSKIHRGPRSRHLPYVSRIATGMGAGPGPQG